MPIVSKTPHALEHGNFKDGLQETEKEGVAYDRHGNMLIRGSSKIQRSWACCATPTSEPTEPKEAPSGPNQALDHAFFRHHGRPGPGHLRLDNVTNKIFCYVVTGHFLRLAYPIATTFTEKFFPSYQR
jgi:hypothetical protein